MSCFILWKYRWYPQILRLSSRTSCFWPGFSPPFPLPSFLRRLRVGRLTKHGRLWKHFQHSIEVPCDSIAESIVYAAEGFFISWWLLCEAYGNGWRALRSRHRHRWWRAVSYCFEWSWQRIWPVRNRSNNKSWWHKFFFPSRTSSILRKSSESANWGKYLCYFWLCPIFHCALLDLQEERPCISLL